MSAKLIEKVEAGGALERAEAEALMEELLGGRLDTAAIVRLLTALNARPYRATELAAFARVMRRHAARVFAEGETPPANMVDTCGTGGDGAQTFNISTAAAIVAAAAGTRVAKHGNRAASSLSGSADVLEALGVRIDMPFLETGKAIREIGIGFLFAQAAHTATRHAMPARKQMGVRTVFNLLGPLTNPAGAQAQVLGLFSADVLDLVAETLRELGTERAMVIHGAGGLDEISLAGATQIVEVSGGKITRYEVTPEEFGIERAPLDAIRGGTAADNAALLQRIFEGERGPAHDIVAVNAGAALVVTGEAKSLREGAAKASEAMKRGAAKGKLAELRNFRGEAPRHSS
ncbi:MAG TPA: anthranilate phosphoribosyltransferase [Candidatus Acidoferrum sp.]|nr:anthranilate phosphoribosyltransferase [Candidatus Acidoferrum sp.]